MKKKNNDVNVDLIIKEIKEFLKTGKEMTYVKSLNYDDNYKEKEIQKLIEENKKSKFKNKFKKIFKKLFNKRKRLYLKVFSFFMANFY